MKTKLFYFFLSILLSSCAYSQQLKELPQNKNVKLLDIMWKLDKNNIYDYYPEQDYFYRILIIKVSEGESNLEGESKDRLLLLKGDYGEYPDGKIFDLGTKYNVINCKFKLDSVIITYGSKQHPKVEKFKLPIN